MEVHARVIDREGIEARSFVTSPCGIVSPTRRALARLAGLGRGLARLRLLRGLHGGLHGSAHRPQALRLVHVVEVAGLAFQPHREHGQAAHGLRGGLCLHPARVGAGAGFGGAVVVAAHHQQRAGVLLVQGLGHVCQVARVKGHGHG